MDDLSAGSLPRGRRPRRKANKLRAWLMGDPRPMTVGEFAAKVGCTPSYVSQLTSDSPPWPHRDIAIKIAFLTGGAVTPNDLAGYVEASTKAQPALPGNDGERQEAAA